MAKNLNSRMIRRIILSVAVILVLGFVYGVYYINSLLPIITGYPAKYLCSAVFISNRSQADVEALDLKFSFLRFTKNEVNLQDSSVISSFLWGKSKAIFRKGFGATLLRGVKEEDLRKIKFPAARVTYNQDTIAWPMGNIMPKRTTNIDTVKLDKITEHLMDADGYNGHAFAFMVVHKGIPVVEAYQPEFNKKTCILCWSVAKSFTNTLAGIMVRNGKWDINKPINLPEWKNDERKNITINDLLQMQSGLQWNEDYGNRSDVTTMLYIESDFAKFQTNKPLASPIGKVWNYSGGSTNLVNYLIRKTISDDNEYYRFAHSYLFNRIGMPDAVFEVDASGTQAGSSYIYATARDYARYGLLYLQDGIFNGERILPEGWVKYSTSPNAHSNSEYGSQFYLNKSKYYPSLPEDMYWCEGHDGQCIFIIPSKELVVVILGFSHLPDHGMNDGKLLADIISTIK